jgi:DNA-directed RNA polymerase alpha subunit
MQEPTIEELYIAIRSLKYLLTITTDYDEVVSLNHCILFLNRRLAELDKDFAQNKIELHDILALKVDRLNVGVRCRNLLSNLGMIYIGDLATFPQGESWYKGRLSYSTAEARLKILPGFGVATLHDLKAALAEYGLTLDMYIPGWKEYREQINKL